MFYYKFPFDVTFHLKDIGPVRRAVDFSKDELLTTAELRKWFKRPGTWETFDILEGYECSS